MTRNRYIFVFYCRIFASKYGHLLLIDAFLCRTKNVINFYRSDHLFELKLKTAKIILKSRNLGETYGKPRFWVAWNAFFFSEYVTKMYVRLQLFEL